MFSLKYLDMFVSCESHWALIYYLLTVWVLNQEVDFNLDLNWGLRSNLTRRFFIPYLSCCKCSLTVIIFARYIFWNKGGFGWSIGKMAYLVTGSHWHKSQCFNFLHNVYCLIFSLHLQVVQTAENRGRENGGVAYKFLALATHVYFFRLFFCCKFNTIFFTKF